MADQTVYHVTPHDEGWAVTKEGATRASAVEAKKGEAVDTAREYAKKQTPSQVIVHKKDGTIQKQFTYPADDDASSNGADAAKSSAKSAPKSPAKAAKKSASKVPVPTLPDIDKDALVQELKVRGDQLVDQVRTLVEEGNARRVIIKKDGRTVMELPLSVGVGGAAAAILVSPVLAALGALGALVADVDVVVERDPKKV